MIPRTDLAPTSSAAPLWRGLTLCLAALTLWLSLTTSEVAAQTAYPPLQLQVTRSTRYQMRADPRTGEVLVRILGGRQDIPEQVARWAHPLLKGAVAVPRSGGEVVIRLRLRWRVTVYGALKGDPARLLLGLGTPIEEAGPLYARLAVDFLGPAPTDGAGGSEAGPPAPLTPQGRARQALYLPDVAPEEEPPPEHALALGSRVLYSIPHPTWPGDLDRWEPTFALPASVKKGAPAAIKQLWMKARGGDLKGALAASETLLVGGDAGPWRTDILYLQAGLFHLLAGDPAIPELTPVDRARRAVATDPDHPLAEQTSYFIGTGYLALGFHHEASRALHDLAISLPDKHPHKADVLLALGLSDEAREKPNQSIDSLKEALELVSGDRLDEIILALATSELKAGHGRGGLTLLNLLRERGSEWIDSHYFKHLEAEALYRTDQFRKAQTRFEALLEEEGDSPLGPWLQLRIGECLLMEHELNQATTYFTRDISLRSLGSLDRILAGTLWNLRSVQLKMLSQSHRIAQANLPKLEQLRLEVPLSPIEPEVLFELGKFYYRGEDVHSAVPYLRDLFARYPEFPFRRAAVQLVWEGFRAAAEERYAVGDSFGVVTLYAQFLPIIDAEAVGDAETFFRISHSYLRLGLYDAAYHALAPAFFLAETGSATRTHAALMTSMLQRLRGNPEDALPALTFIEKKSDDPEMRLRALLEEARVRQDLGELEEARALFGRFADQAADLPELALARLAEGRLNLELDDPNAAADALSDAIQAARRWLPTDREEEGGTPTPGPVSTEPHPAEPAGERLAANGPLWMDWTTPTLEELAECRLDALFLLGEAQLNSGRMEEAADAFEEALRRAPEHPSAGYARFTLGRAQHALGREDEARATWSALVADAAAFEGSPWPDLAAQMLAQTTWEQTTLEGRR